MIDDQGNFLGSVSGGCVEDDLIERVRQLSVAYRLKKDASAGRVLDRLLKNLSADQTVTDGAAFTAALRRAVRSAAGAVLDQLGDDVERHDSLGWRVRRPMEEAS